jgi:hypothetical protein
MSINGDELICIAMSIRGLQPLILTHLSMRRESLQWLLPYLTRAFLKLEEDNRTAATGAANTIAFRVNGEDGEVLAKNFDTTPTQVVVGEEPIRAPVSDVIGHLVKGGHNDARVTRFGQTHLQKGEDFIKKYDQFPKQDGLYGVIY